VFDLIVYEQDEGQRPYEKWFKSLRDKRAQSRIVTRLDQVRAGNLGDCRSVGEGVIELRIDAGPGYRIYCGRSGATLVVLLLGGDKGSQQKDIDRAKWFWAELEAEADMKTYKTGIPYHDWEVEQLRKDPELATECLKLALESLNSPEERGGSLLTLRALAEAYGGIGAIAAKAGISRESLYRSLSPKGNPTLKTLIAVLSTMGLRLSVVPQPRKTRERAPKKKSAKAARAA
jgi:putative addiction module killer protein/probable addiction module antidote protein